MSSKPPSKEPEFETLRYYDQNAIGFFKDTVGIDMAPQYQPFLALLTPGAHILDAGCGSGRDSRNFIDAGFRVTAFDASESMVSLATKHIGRQVLHLSFLELDFTAEFDGIWASASLLHLQRKDLQPALNNLIKALRPGGILYASFKYGEGEHFRNGRHFTDFSEDTFQQLIEIHPSMELLNLWITPDLRPGRKKDRWLNALLRKIST